MNKNRKVIDKVTTCTWEEIFLQRGFLSYLPHRKS